MTEPCKTALCAGLFSLAALPAMAGGGTTCDPAAHENSWITATTPTAEFTDHFDGTVTHDNTGLMWAKCSRGQVWVDNTPNDASDDACSGSAADYDWRAALAQAQSANGASHLGYNDWRLPNANELESIVERRCWNPAINAAIFPNAVSNLYWSSSPYPNGGSGAWFVGFSSGDLGTLNKSFIFRVRLVRAGQ